MKTLVSIVIPTLGRPEKLHRLLWKIKENAGYDNYEVLVGVDEFPPNNIGVPKMVKRLVEQAKGDLIMYLGNDCIPEKDFLQLAVFRMRKAFPNMDGLVGLNDGFWKAGEFATHWLASKKLLPYLGGEFFHTGYFHCGCDNELTEMCRKANKYVWAEEAKIDHDHPVKTGFKTKDMDAVYALAYQKDRMEHDRDLLHERAKLLKFELRENFTEPTQIPKRIFTIWLNNKKTIPKDIKSYINTHNIPGYEHKLITLNNCYRNDYVDAAIKTKQWAKAADYLRCHYLVEEGGIYLDADVEVLPRRNFDRILNNSLFAGREVNGFISNAVIGATKGNKTLKRYLEEVLSKFKGDDDKVFEAAMEILTPMMEKDNATILPPDYFFPYDHQNNVTVVTDNSITLHHFKKSWVK